MIPSPREIDTIAAIATAIGPAGIGIIRVSGPHAFAVADAVTRGRGPTARQKTHTLRRATFHDSATGEALDDGLLAVFHAPHSFTGEDVVEFQSHGGTLTLTRLFSSTLAAGARAARPGEFSERAFVNGHLDLAQAEAVADLINAGTVAAQRAARRQLEGELSLAVRTCTEAVLEALANIEASIDFPEEVGEVDVGTVDAALARANETVLRLLSTAQYGRRLRDGMTVALTGRPNVGKSSLLNALAGADRAIVTPVPGTTRDIVEEAMNFSGIPVRVLDTAGIRPTEDPVERIGVDRARRAIVEADVAILVLDAASGITAEDKALLNMLGDQPVVVAVNKADLAAPDHLLAVASERFAAVATAATTGEGLAALTDAVVTAAAGSALETGVAPLVTVARHEAALREAATALGRARATLDAGAPIEFVAVDAHGAIQALGEITGETTREDVIAGIFSRFCVGK